MLIIEKGISYPKQTKNRPDKDNGSTKNTSVNLIPHL
jgi:hypothetical protein